MRALIRVAAIAALMTTSATAQGKNTSPPIERELYAHAMQCSEAALERYSISSIEPAETVARTAFDKCADEWQKAAEASGRSLDATPDAQEARKNCINKLGASACPPPLPTSIYLMDAARRTFVHDGAVKVFDIRAEAAKK